MAENVQHMEFAEDPERCQGVGSLGQCQNKGQLQSDGKRLHFCSVHQAGVVEKIQKQESLRNYRLTKFQAQLDRHATSPQIKNLRDEVAILRMMLEEKLNKCQDSTDLILQSGAISDLVLKIDKLVGSCHKLEGSMNQLLDKQAVLQFASEMIAAISEDIEDTVILDRITGKLMAAIGRIGTDESIRETDGQ